MATVPSIIGSNNFWSVTLTVSPDRVFAGDKAQLEVVLSHPDVDPQHIPYNSFHYEFVLSDPRFNVPPSPPNSRTCTLSIPQLLPEGDYEVSVTVTERSNNNVPVNPAFPRELTISTSLCPAPGPGRGHSTTYRDVPDQRPGAVGGHSQSYLSPGFHTLSEIY